MPIDCLQSFSGPSILRELSFETLRKHPDQGHWVFRFFSLGPVSVTLVVNTCHLCWKVPSFGFVAKMGWFKDTSSQMNKNLQFLSQNHLQDYYKGTIKLSVYNLWQQDLLQVFFVCLFVLFYPGRSSLKRLVPLWVSQKFLPTPPLRGGSVTGCLHFHNIH